MATVSGTLFLAKPQTLYVDQDYSVKPPAYHTIDHLMQSLQEHGPLVTYGKRTLSTPGTVSATKTGVGKGKKPLSGLRA